MFVMALSIVVLLVRADPTIVHLADKIFTLLVLSPCVSFKSAETKAVYFSILY